MQKFHFYLVGLIFVLFDGVLVHAESSTAPGNPFGTLYEIPIQVNDNDEYLYGVGQKYGGYEYQGDLIMEATKQAKEQIKIRVKSSLKKVITTVSSVANDNGNIDAYTEVEERVEETIDKVINDAELSQQPVISAIDPSGNVNCWVGVRVKRKVLAENLSKVMKQWDKALDQNKIQQQLRENPLYQ